MPFTITQFVKIRPFLFHLTDRNNLDHIRYRSTLYSAASLMHQAGRTHLLRHKRSECVKVHIGSATVNIRDQQPLHAGNINLQSDWSFEDLIQSLNERVFFWPGKSTGPISYGVRHFERYADEQPAMLRISTADLFASNSNFSPLFCRFNSGSPRCSNGVGSPRGPNTFVTCSQANFTPSKVVEVIFAGKVNLPTVIEIAESFNGPWRSI